jgi:hypothetical protein
MHLELPSDVVEPLGHAEDGRDADAAGEQKRSLGSVREGKVILGLADLEDIALLDVVVHCIRAATRVGGTQHADEIAMRFARIAGTTYSYGMTTKTELPPDWAVLFCRIRSAGTVSIEVTSESAFCERPAGASNSIFFQRSISDSLAKVTIVIASQLAEST